ncbi:MAG TPA: ubiquinol oxidase subunit II [Buchnera sp. (in: enterobacteria)]|nr:ubiquinol oxidase subunit II [Buchnera sp. (in: enterobacteria)]
MKKKYFFKILLLIGIVLSLSACQSSLFNPQGHIAIEQRLLILISFFMMLMIVIPVILMTIVFSIKYSFSNKNAKYSPNWDHSKKIEMFIWIIPIFIISCLAVLSWKATYKLEPSRALHSFIKPIKIDVIALDWKWLFIYPDYNIATINQVVFPINTPIVFRITSNSVMNSFFIPSLGSQIYAMAGMEKKLHLIGNVSGSYKGFSANYSGSGFSNMKFRAIVKINNTAFNKWITIVKRSNHSLNTMKMFYYIAQPYHKYDIEYFSSVHNNLFKKVIKRFKNN